MTFVLTEEEESIRRVARDLARERLPIAELRRLRDTRDGEGFSREVWKEMAALGLAGMILPERVGGAALGYAALGLVAEEEGRTLAVTPRFSSIVLCGALLAREANAARMESVLPALCAGDRLLALAHDEGRAHSRHRVATRATAENGGYRLDGEKVMVLDGHVADALVVVARTEGAPADRDGITLFLVPASAPGLTVVRTTMIDSRNAARVRLDGVRPAAADVIGVAGRGADLLDPVLDAATAVLAAEMLGGMQEAFDRTLAYLKTRRQFGVPIGSFQALKHRAAQMFCEIELSRSIVMHALRAADREAHDLPALAAAAKARTTDAYLSIASEAVQMHGGIGVTDELDIGLFLKRARACEMTLGDASYQRERFARANGY